MFYFKVNHLNKSTKFRDWLSSNDLFVLLKYNKEVRRTTVKWNNNNPTWNESFIFNESDEKTIVLSIYDEDAYSKSDKVQEYAVNIKNGEIKKYKTKYLEIEMGTMVPQSNLLESEKKIKEYEKSLNDMKDKIEKMQQNGDNAKEFLNKAIAYL
jgi:Ca2+-dependent lipid-binding protein